MIPQKFTWKDIRKHIGMSKMMFADYLGMERSNYTRKEKYERKMNAEEMRMLINKFEFLNVNNLIISQEELDEYTSLFK